jgi:hypothetical protein
MIWKTKQFRFNSEMEKDFELIKQTFKTSFGVDPSNTDIQRLLIKTFKEKKPQIQRKARSTEWEIL